MSKRRAVGATEITQVRDERALGYLLVFANKNGEVLVHHQYAPDRNALFRHIAETMSLAGITPKLADHMMVPAGFKLTCVSVADLVPLPTLFRRTRSK